MGRRDSSAHVRLLEGHHTCRPSDPRAGDHTLDLTATIARAAGLDLNVLEGKSLLPRLVGDEAMVTRPHGELQYF